MQRKLYSSFFLRVCFVLLVTMPALLHAQQLGNLRHKKIPTGRLIGGHPWQVDSLSIVPGSFQLEGTAGGYRLEEAAATISWQPDAINSGSSDSIWVHYRVFPFLLQKQTARYVLDTNSAAVIRPQPEYPATAQSATLFKFGKIDYNGSFGRSMSIGNNQNAVFNSEFNLQMNGFIGDSIHLTAALTDDNIPIQPDGTTQQLNEFDKILLQFSKKNWEINLGDIDLRTEGSYYVNFYKRLQGASYRQQVKLGSAIKNSTIVSGAIAKGKFARNVLAVSEGNQGPYRLQGNNNELYFVVLAGTEKVYLDGALLTRGEDQDYTIDYNQAEITFTPRHMITQDSRIQVSFEYADRNYLNTMMYVQNATEFSDKVTLTVSAYNNQDSKSQPINQTLDAGKRAFLAEIGDSIQNAFYPFADMDTFSTDKIMYKKIDTLYNGVHDSVYVYSTSKDSARYALSFAEVGTGKGNYEPLLSLANGKVFTWVAPVNGVPQGSYEPAEFLVTPKKQQLLSVKVDYHPDSSFLLSTELATSNTDNNTFSTLGNGDNTGYAGKVTATKRLSWQPKNGDADLGYYLNSTGSFEFQSAQFKTIEILRPVEFARSWGLELIPENSADKLGSIQFALSQKKLGELSYGFQTYLRQDGYKGFKHELGYQHNSLSGWNFNEGLSYTGIHMATAKGYYWKPALELSKTLKKFHKLTLGARYEAERNQIQQGQTDSMWLTSYSYETLSAFVRSDPAAVNNWQLTYTGRKNKLPVGNRLVGSDHSRNLSFDLSLLKNRYQQIKLKATYRELTLDDSVLTTGSVPDRSFLGRVAYNVRSKSGFLSGNALYETGAGQEQKRDYSFYEVSPGQGQYTWNDYNNDGIQQLNEFELAAFSDEATFIKIYTPTNEYIQADYTQFNYSVQLNPRKIIADSATGWSAFVRKLQLRSSLQSAKKQYAMGGPVFNPFATGVADSALLNFNYIFSNTLSFGQLSSKWGLDLTRLINYNKSLLTYGSEATKITTWDLKGRWQIAPAYNFVWQQQFGTHDLLTPAFESRNFALTSMSANPTLTYTNRTRFRLTGGYEYEKVKNKAIYGGETATNSSLQLEGKYNAVQQTSLTGRFQYTHIDFDGDQSSTVSYNMLQGLSPGKNYRFVLELNKRLMGSLELSFQYEGRKSGDAKFIQIGRASIRAIL
ncbi:hypothetical protein SAMN05192529_10474 [Arachidicoccus rhizosphaerae]|uniref:Uncharacterized protein n=1 Tax=Arachidicoccus rhizosphaerae TaxID=551991 RepID=A0A1H3WXR9_9BACT|nr:hypothetical protein [Arachidicoccus rhizosphaerae]SDZ91945.1 hypothetical protein SAMN05192529_10474 [Arachidicoccus rhizosphaerae]